MVVHKVAAFEVRMAAVGVPALELLVAYFLMPWKSDRHLNRIHKD